MTAIPRPGRGPIPSRIVIILMFLMAACWAAAPCGAMADHHDHYDHYNDGSSLAISKATWRHHSLYAQGTAPSRATVTIENTASGAVLGSTRSSRKGSWTFRRELSGAPCSITARAAGMSATRAVSDAPSDCDNGQTPTPNLSGLSIAGPDTVNEGASAQYSCAAAYDDGTSQDVTTGASWSDDSAAASISNGLLTAGTVSADQTVIISASYTADGITVTASKSVTILDGSGPPPPNTSQSINSTSRNRATLPAGPVAEQPFVNLDGYKVFGVNDLGMHCGDLDHRVASILPPFNVLHTLVVRQGSGSTEPEILTPSDCEVVYSAASNPDDPALQNPPMEPVFKTNFWDPNPARTGSSLAFDAYDPFYPPSVLSLFPLEPDMGLPVPDLALLYPLSGASQLVADQQNMPGVAAPYADNAPQVVKRFDTDLPFFVDFPFGYQLSEMNWFAADGIPMAPVDDFGRKNSFPLVRVQARSVGAGDILGSVDTVLPVSAEADCFRCHASTQDGGGGQAACIPGVDANCTEEGSPRSGTAFPVALAADDTADVPLSVKREWAADNNIIRLHDAKHGTNLQAATPVTCQTCHYTPALDLAHLGPVGPDDPDANGKEQRIHRSNSRVMHAFHAQFTDLFVDDMPPPDDSRRLDPATGRPVANSFVKDKLNQSCYQCHPGRQTQCLRGAMFNGGLVCQDCHGGMQQVGDDFSRDFSVSRPFPDGADLTKRVPWATMPACQSCHTGDAMNNLGQTDANVVKAGDGIRLLQAYRTNDTADATPIVASNKRFAENDANGNRVLYRFSKGHSGLFCEACHGSTHAEWPVQPESGNYIANDNMAAIQLQGHAGKIIECTTCHTGSLPNTLGGPHGLHPVGATGFANGGHENLAKQNRDACRACHGINGEGTVLSKTAAARTLSNEGRQVNLAEGQMVSCNLCHGNPL
jgi:hypothetical protein